MSNKLLTIQLSKFVIIGISNTIISYLVFIVAFKTFLTGDAFASQSISYFSGILWSFYWNSKWTFSSDRKKSTLFISFILLQGALLFLSSFMMDQAIKYLEWNVTIIWILVMGFITIINFAFSKLLVFKS